MKIKRMFKMYSDGEHFDQWVGKDNFGIKVTFIEYHEPQIEGDAHYCDIGFSNGKITRIFRPDEVEFN